MTPSYTIGDYLLDRLKELGVRHLFGVPGDYNLGLLDRVLDTDGVEWVGTANELNAAYAADGYARIGGSHGTAGLGVVVTTLGVGELSALNGIAGSAAEQVPVLQVTGAPAAALESARARVHHTFGDGDFRRFARAYAEVTCAQAWPSADDAPAEIDRLLAEAVRRRMPVHLTLAADVVAGSCAPPAAPLAVDGVTTDHTDPHARADFASFLQRHLTTIGSMDEVVVLAGHLADRFGLTDRLRDLVRATGARSAALHRGKGVLDETHPGFLGLYAGELTLKAHDVIAGASLLVSVGPVAADGVVPFTRTPDAVPVLTIEPGTVRVGDCVFAPLRMDDALAVVTTLLRQRRIELSPNPYAAAPARRTTDAQAGVTDRLGQRELWGVVEEFLRPGDLLMAENGTPYYGALPVRLPAGVDFLAQGLWSSIGYTLPALLGAQLALPADRRALLVIGDGSLQLTAQELGSFTRHGLNPAIIVIDNDGYTVERVIHRPDAGYHDIARWDWRRLPAAVGFPTAEVTRVDTVEGLRTALAKARANPGVPAFVQAVLPERDAPPLLTAIAEIVTRRNAY